MPKKKILIAPLNWGLGHATRCIPIINALIKFDFEPIIATDGVALSLLKKEFPDLKCLELPSYNITYSKKGRLFKFKLMKQLPNILKAVREEKKIVDLWIDQYDIKGIISDNRLGVYSKKVPSIFITHQLTVLTGSTSWITTKLHHYYIKKFNECWVPDIEKSPNLTGKLGHLENTTLNIKYIGALSRLHKKVLEKKYDLMVILSGPEPQRSMLEEKLNEELKLFDGTILFIKGIIEDKQSVTNRFNITTYNYMNSEELELAFNQSSMVLCRSGYTTIMDLANLGKKAFFIPTPGQYEQEYLAVQLDKKGLIPYCEQDDFKLSQLNRVAFYSGLKQYSSHILWKDLFNSFQSK